MCNMTNNNSYGSGLTSFNEVCKHVVYILDGVIVSFTNSFMIL